MRSIDFTLENKRKIMGDRLKEMLQRANMSQSQLQNIAKNKYDWPVSQPFINQICNGKRTLQVEDAKVFGKILDADPGYLIGMDDFRASCYSEYPDQMESIQVMRAAERAYNEYDLFLALMGYKVSAYGTINGESGSYAIERMTEDKSVSDISAKEMESFRSDVIKYMTDRFESLFAKHEHQMLYKFSSKEIDELIERYKKNELTNDDRDLLLDSFNLRFLFDRLSQK